MRAFTLLAFVTVWLAVQPEPAVQSAAPAPRTAAAQIAEPQAAPEPAAPDPGTGAAASAAVTAAAGVDARAAFHNLQTDLAGIIRRPGWRDDRWSVLVVSLDHGDTLYAQGAYDPLAPASNMKLFTTAAALYYLGADFRWNTFLMATGSVRDGVLEGDLVLYGTGDPTFSARFGRSLAVWTAFADTLEARGIRQVRGDIVGDGSYFEGPGVGEGWQHTYMNAAYAASAGALSYAENVATLQISPASQTGWRPTVRLVPGGEGIAVVNQATTVASGSSRIHAARMAYDGPIVIRGQIARGSAPVTRSVPVSDPARFAAAVFREVLEQRGIVVAGGLRSAQTASESPVTGRSVFAPALDTRDPVRVLAVHTSPPVIQVLDIINKRSHNLMSEQVLRTIGRVATGEGSVAGGRRAIEHMMHAEGHPAPAEIEVYDGSGLSILNRSSARGIVSLLAVMAESSMWHHYWETLPEAGTSVGLRRMHRTPAEGNLRAKTGTIDRVSALSGYVRAADGERLAFAIISNNVPSTWMAKRVEDAIGTRLAEFDRSAPGQVVARTPAADRAAAPARQGSGRSHTIRRGDTLDGIARQYGTSVAALQRANPGLNPRRLIPGRTVRIP